MCFQNMANNIINKKWYEERTNNMVERIVTAAAKLIKSQIRETRYNLDVYPSLDEI